MAYRVERFADNPIVRAGMDAAMGANIQGPSLIRVPEWVKNPLGRYYLYFADHKGSYIRLACADALKGPWRVHAPGSLQLAESKFPTAPIAVPADAAERIGKFRLDGLAPPGTPDIPAPLEDATWPHIASPDVHVDDEARRIVMYYHGLSDFRVQLSRVATSADGIHFDARAPLLGPPYFRVFRYGGYVYALAMPGIMLRSKDGFENFERGPTLFGRDMRHTALLKRGDTLHIFWTRAGDAPERIYASRVDLRGDWTDWCADEPVEVLRPEMEWEGASLPMEKSFRGAIKRPVNQLRDPAIYEEDGRVFMLYAVAGESGIAIAELFLDR